MLYLNQKVYCPSCLWVSFSEGVRDTQGNFICKSCHSQLKEFTGFDKIETQQKDTFLYVLSCENKLKIGVTGNIEKRIKGLQTGNPNTIKLEYIEERYLPHKAEKYLHKYFQKHRMIGEWFSGITVHQIRSALMMFHEQECEK